MRSTSARPSKRLANTGGEGQDGSRGLADAVDGTGGGGRVVALPLLGDVDDPAGVGQEVRHVERAGRVEQLGHLRAGQLVVGATDDDDPSERPGPLGGDVAPQGAGRQHVDRGLVPRVGRHGAGGSRLEGPPDAISVHVGDEHLGPLGHEELDQRTPDLAHPEHQHPAAPQAGAPGGPARRLHRPEHPSGGERARVPGAAPGGGGAGDVGRAAPDAVHVVLVGAHVLRRQVPAAEGVHGVGEGVDQRRRLRRRVSEDHRLAATEVEARDRRLGRHGPGQP
jgi:hypothetical protein